MPSDIAPREKAVASPVTENSNRDIEDARSLHRELRALFDSSQPEADGEQKLAQVRRLCASIGLDDAYLREALRAVENYAVYYFRGEDQDAHSGTRRSRLRALILTLVEALQTRLLEIEARRQMLAVHWADAANAAQPTHCEAGGRRIPIVMQDRHGRAAPRELRYFTSGEGGAHESGVYAFWSVLAGPVAIFIFRSPADSPIDARLREYIGKNAHRTELLQQLADRVMPSTADEVDLWLRAHPIDARFALANPEPAQPGAAA
jgi:hypothetical protein